MVLLARLRPVAGLMCHQLPERLLFPDGLLCARCSGIYLGILAGALAQLLFPGRRGSKLPAPQLCAAAVLWVTVMALDGLFSEGIYTGSNILRLFTGLMAGTSMSLFLIPLLNASSSWGRRWPIVDRWTVLAVVYLPAMLLLGLGSLPWEPLQILLSLLAFLSLLGLYLALNFLLLSTLSAALARCKLRDQGRKGAVPTRGQARFRELALLCGSLALSAAEMLLIGWSKRG